MQPYLWENLFLEISNCNLSLTKVNPTWNNIERPITMQYTGLVLKMSLHQ